MEMIAYTVVAIALYLFADRLLERIEVSRGARLKHRSVIFFVMLASLAMISFWLIRTLLA